jgi:hypothetical protein
MKSGLRVGLQLPGGLGSIPFFSSSPNNPPNSCAYLPFNRPRPLRQLHCGSCTAASRQLPLPALRQLHCGSCPCVHLPLRASALGQLHWGICNAARISANREAGPYLFSLRYLSRKFWNHVLPKMLEYLLIVLR